MINHFSKSQIATSIAILFHTVGLLIIIFLPRNSIPGSTPLNLLLMFVLLLWTQKDKNVPFMIFLTSTIMIGFIAEFIGTNTGLIFGKYGYGELLGIKMGNVPLIVGINWFVIIFCSGIAIHTLLRKTIHYISLTTATPPKTIKSLSLIIDGATVAVFFDWLMEPVAIKLGYWKWVAGKDIPMYNYISWLVISMTMLVIFQFCKFNKQNKFAVNLLLIQGMFFLILRTFLP